jgi:hypothetical protein
VCESWRETGWKWGEQERMDNGSRIRTIRKYLMSGGIFMFYRNDRGLIIDKMPQIIVKELLEGKNQKSKKRV